MIVHARRVDDTLRSPAAGPLHTLHGAEQERDHRFESWKRTDATCMLNNMHR